MEQGTEHWQGIMLGQDVVPERKQGRREPMPGCPGCRVQGGRRVLLSVNVAKAGRHAKSTKHMGLHFARM